MFRLFYILLFSCNFAIAVSDPDAGRKDPRIKHLAYSQNEVFRINAHYGRTSHITFDQDEEILLVDTGDAIAWDITPVNNHLIIKPTEHEADTNMNILTNKRIYHFELIAHESKSIGDSTQTFAINFFYPQDILQKQIHKQQQVKRQSQIEVVPNRKINPANWNWQYSRKGSDQISPKQVWDDGEFTYFQFSHEIEVPAIFIVDDEKNESLVNYHTETGKNRSHFIVVERTAKQFILRSGVYATCIFNDKRQKQTISLNALLTGEFHD
jgi:type IV secretion system protein VirB9